MQNVSSMPTFIFYRNKVIIERVRGADAQLQGLESKIREHFSVDLQSLEKFSVNIELVRRLEKNNRVNLIAAINIYLKLITNILANPQEEKFRKFKKTNPRISKELLSIDGMKEMLFDSGFEDSGDEFVMEVCVMKKLKTYQEFFKVRVEDLKNLEEFLRPLEHLSDSVMQYEDPLLQQSALKLIPRERFRLSAIEKLRKIQKLILNGELKEPEPLLDDLILEELAAWFKNEFFTWINSAPCHSCKNVNTQSVGSSSSNGVRIEKYLCTLNSCNTTTEFPRYNDIQKLLVTRSGRCGEFANCFTFLCRCLGFDARYIYCTSDHVWTEVYNHGKKRWIHIDPSENVFDSPLMYEAGWKRNLEYVFAFSRDDVQDVTWRYTSNHDEVKKRRKMCSEKDLVQVIMQLRQKRQSNVSKARKKFLDLRTLAELAELMIQRQPTEDEKRGRTSGSLTWRLERGETSLANFHIFLLSDDEKIAKEFNIRYSCSKNSFERVVNFKATDSTEDWSHWCHNVENIFRKVEHDHKMVYLARTEESTEGSFKLKFDFADMKIQSIELKCDLTTFHSGKTDLKVLDDSDRAISQEELKGRSKFSIKVNVSGGNGDCAWQHAQIFRQPLNSDEFPFQLSVKLDK